MIKLIKRISSAIGIGARAFVALVGVAGITAAVANYTMTQGAGTNFGSIVVSTVHYAQQLLCDVTTPSQCAAVDSSGNVSVNLKAETTKVIGTVRTASGGIASGSVASGAVASGAIASGAVAAGAFATGAGVDGWDITQGAKADSVCGSATGTCSVVALLKYLNTAAGLPLPVQTGIGNVNIGAVQSAGSMYETVAASQTAQVLGPTGATGDYLSHCVIQPGSTSPGAVTVFDNANAAATNVISFPGGASSVSNLTPISVPVGAVSTAGAWKVTTTSGVTVACFGKFT